jgi:pyruvate dehydrogenase E2 component (dihydrolipoamide acetyltransferase)
MATDIKLTGGAGEYMESATVVAWNIAVGTPVKTGEVVAVVETAKAATEIEAPADGILLEILAPLHAEVAVGTVLGRIGTADEAALPALGEAKLAGTAAEPRTAPGLAPRPSARRRIASPLARRLAAAHGIDLGQIEGTGPHGRIKRRDIDAALHARERVAMPSRPATPVTEPASEREDRLGLTVPIVLIHGFGASKATWTGLLPRLRPHGRTIRIELPGHGQQSRMGGSLEEMVDSAIADLAAQGLSEVHLVGHSLGGAVAAEIAALGQIEVRSLTLLAPAGLGPEINGAFIDGFLRAGRPESLQPWLDRLVADPSTLPASYAGAVLREREQGGLVGHQTALARALFPDGTQTIGIARTLRQLPMPTRVIWGLCDEIIPASHLGSLSGATGLHRLKGVGHMPHVEAPDLVARLILENCRAGTLGG